MIFISRAPGVVNPARIPSEAPKLLMQKQLSEKLSLSSYTIFIDWQ